MLVFKQCYRCKHQYFAEKGNSDLCYVVIVTYAFNI